MSQSGIIGSGGGGGGGITTIDGNSGYITGTTVTIEGDGVNVATTVIDATTMIISTPYVNVIPNSPFPFLAVISIGDFANGGAPDTTQYSIAIGYGANGNLSGGSYNVPAGLGNIAIGYQAYGGGNQEGFGSYYNTVIGIQAGFNYNTVFESSEVGNIILGSTPGTAGESNVMRLGNNTNNDITGNMQTAATYIYGIAGVTVGSSATVLIDTSTGQLGTVSSSARYKDNIQDMGDTSSAIMKLRPVTFNFKKFPEVSSYGLIAEEVEQIMPNLVVKDKEGRPETIKYHEMPAMLLNELQKQAKMIEELRQEIKELKKG